VRYATVGLHCLRGRAGHRVRDPYQRVVRRRHAGTRERRGRRECCGARRAAGIPRPASRDTRRRMHGDHRTGRADGGGARIRRGIHATSDNKAAPRRRGVHKRASRIGMGRSRGRRDRAAASQCRCRHVGRESGGFIRRTSEASCPNRGGAGLDCQLADNSMASADTRAQRRMLAVSPGPRISGGDGPDDRTTSPRSRSKPVSLITVISRLASAERSA